MRLIFPFKYYCLEETNEVVSIAEISEEKFVLIFI